MASQMMDSISKAAHELDEAEKDIVKFSLEGLGNQVEREDLFAKLIEMATKGYNAKTSLEEELSKVTNYKVGQFDSKTKKMIERIRDQETFRSVEMYLLLCKLSGSEFRDEQDLLWASKTDEFFEDFHSWFDVFGYYSDKMRVGAILHYSHQIPKEVCEYFDEIRECFAFGLRRSSIALCRALLEIAFVAKTRNCKPRQSGTKTYSLESKRKDIEEEDKLYFLINRAFHDYRLIDKGIKETAHSVRLRANGVLHLEKQLVEPNEENALAIISDTLKVIEHLYRM